MLKSPGPRPIPPTSTMTTERLSPVATAPAAVSGVAVPLPAGGAAGDDPFARHDGPVVVMNLSGAEVRVYTHFSVDPDTHEVQVAIVDQAGRLVRMIPPNRVRQMLDAMNAYGG